MVGHDHSCLNCDARGGDGDGGVFGLGEEAAQRGVKGSRVERGQVSRCGKHHAHDGLVPATRSRRRWRERWVWIWRRWLVDEQHNHECTNSYDKDQRDCYHAAKDAVEDEAPALLKWRAAEVLSSAGCTNYLQPACPRIHCNWLLLQHNLTLAWCWVDDVPLGLEFSHSLLALSRKDWFSRGWLHTARMTMEGCCGCGMRSRGDHK